MKSPVAETKIPALPALPANLDPQTRRALSAIMEALDIRLGRRGDKLDKAVTFRDLRDGGFTTGGQIISSGGGGGGSSTPIYQTPDAPLNFQVVGAFFNIRLSWGQPANTDSGYAYTEIWRQGLVRDAITGEWDQSNPLFSEAVMVGTAIANMYSDPVGLDTGYFYWIRHVNKNEVPGPISAAVFGSTLRSISDVITAIGDEISQTALDQYLRERIAVIDTLDLDTTLVDGVAFTRLELIDMIATPTTGILAELDLVRATVYDPATGLSATANSLSNLDIEVGLIDNKVIAGIQRTDTLQLEVFDGVGAPRLASIQELSSVSTTVDGLALQYSVKLDNDGYVAGFGLYNSAGTSTFLVNADTFAIGQPGVPGVTPFAVQNGQVYIKSAMIDNASITTAVVGSIISDYGEFTSFLSAPSLFTPTINIGSLSKPDPLDPSTWSVSGTARNGNFSIDASGVLHARGASFFDGNGNLIFGSGGGLDWSRIQASAGRPADNANYTTNTNQLTDGAGLGTKADWPTITGTGKPDNDATRGAPNGTFVGSVEASVVASNLQVISDISADNVLSASEKKQLRIIWDTLYRDYVGVVTKMNDIGLSTTALQSAFNSLGTYLHNTSWTLFSGVPFYITDGQLGINRAIVGSTLRSRWDTAVAALSTAQIDVNNANVHPGNPITGTNISTYISNLAVDTIQIQDNAMTVPTVASYNNLSRSISIPGLSKGPWTDIASFDINWGGSENIYKPAISTILSFFYLELSVSGQTGSRLFDIAWQGERLDGSGARTGYTGVSIVSLLNNGGAGFGTYNLVFIAHIPRFIAASQRFHFVMRSYGNLNYGNATGTMKITGSATLIGSKR